MINVSEFVKTILPYRGNSVVIPGRTSRHWHEYSDKPELDMPLGDPAMGGHACFALGLALAQPNTNVILFDSEGDLLMNLGILTTIAEMAPSNFYHFLLDNECYATTGGQPVPNSTGIQYDLLARGAGYQATYSFEHLEDFSNSAAEIIQQPGPVFTALKVFPEIENLPINQRVRWQTRTLESILKDAQSSLGVQQVAPHGRNMRVIST
ncbi:hypothetical protein FIM02_00555 [SAR202 cluster bacterium AD-802-E10_MRT_200m]|nr:hypothetical protein [SAR202 cluster bacterium AD-802-E10_MRT_200m]